MKQAENYFNAEENKHGVRIDPIQAMVLVFLSRLMRVKVLYSVLEALVCLSSNTILCEIWFNQKMSKSPFWLFHGQSLNTYYDTMAKTISEKSIRQFTHLQIRLTY